MSNMREDRTRSAANHRQNQSVASWPLIIIGFVVFWPLGLFLLYKRVQCRQYTGGARKMNTLTGVGLLFLGAYFLTDILDTLRWGFGWAGLDSRTFAVGLFFLIGGLWILGSSRGLGRMEKYYQKYVNVVGSRNAVSIRVVAETLGISPKRAAYDLERMADKGYFGPTAFVDKRLLYLLRSADAYNEIGVENDDPAPERQSENMDRFTATLREIRSLNDQIADVKLSRQIERVEAITAKIFRATEDEPAKLDDIQTFLNYYLPTTLKLMRTYSQLERQGEDSENIRTAKAKIESIMEELIQGFQRILDHLYREDVMDISTDIEVLERMMAKDGFSDKNRIVIEKESKEV